MLLDSPPFLDASAYLSLPSCTLQHALVLALCVTYAPCLAPSLPLSICFSCPSRVRNRHPHARAHAHTRMRTRERTHTQWRLPSRLQSGHPHAGFSRDLQITSLSVRVNCVPHAHMYIQLPLQALANIHTRTPTHLHARTHARSRARANTRTHTHTHTRNHTNMHTRTCKHAHLYVCLHAHDIDVVYGLESEQRFKASSVTRRQH